MTMNTTIILASTKVPLPVHIGAEWATPSGTRMTVGTSGNPELGNVTRELEEFDTPKVTAAIGSQGGYVKWDVRWGHPPRVRRVT